MDATRAIYEKLDMPELPDPNFLEMGTFIPADSFELVKHIADLRVQDLYDIIGRNQFTSMANYESQKAKLFHTWRNFSQREKHYDSPTRSQEVDFGHSLLAYDANREGYLEYLKDRAFDLWEFLHVPMMARVPIASFRGSHCWVLGMTGAGKSEFIKVMVSKFHPLPSTTNIVLDPERKLAEEIGWSKDYLHGDSMIFIDPILGRNQNLFPIFNPFEFDGDDLDDQATYSEGLVSIFEETLKSDTSERMDTLLDNCIRVLLRRKGSTMLDLTRFMDKRRNVDLVELGNKHPNPLVRDFFQFTFNDSELEKTKKPLSMKLRSLMSRNAFSSCTMGKSTLNFESLIDSRKTIVLSLDEGSIGAMGSRLLGGFFIAMLENTARRMRKSSHAQQNAAPIFLLVDEFQRFVTPRFEEILTRARRLGLHLIAANQYMGQKGLSPELCGNMRINAGVKIIGLFTDPEEARKVSKMIGVEAEELMALGKGKYIIKAGERPPITVQVQSDRLGHSNSMSQSEWEAMERHQLKMHYGHPIDFDTLMSRTSQPSQTTPDKPQDTTQSQTVAAEQEAPQKPTRPPRRPKFGRD